MKELKVPFLAGLLSTLLLSLFTFFSAHENTEGLLQVTFLDVGQGDSIFVESPSGTQILIDGGKGSGVLRELGREMGFFDRDIDMVIATHSDMDHIGGLVDVLMRYHVQTILMTENAGDTPVAEMFSRLVKEEGAKILYARRGQTFELGKGEAGSTTLRILFPDRDPQGLETNTASIVSQLSYGESEYLFTGDSPTEIEHYLIRIGKDVLVSDVLKLGHHGSRTSTSREFLESVRPQYAIILSGKDNSYGHPHKEVVDLLASFGVAQKNTAELGSISSLSDGKSVWFR